MLGLNDYQALLGDTLFDGSSVIAGIVIYAMVLLIIFVFLRRNRFAALLVSLPVTLIMSMMGIIGTDMMVLMIIISALGLAITAKETMG